MTLPLATRRRSAPRRDQLCNCAPKGPPARKDNWFRAVFRVGGPNESHIMADMQMAWPQACRAWLPVALGPRGGVAEKPIQRRILVPGPDSEGHLQPKQVRKVQAIEMFFCA